MGGSQKTTYTDLTLCQLSWQFRDIWLCSRSEKLKWELVQPTKGSSINESAGTLRIRCTWLSFFVITIGPEYKQDTLSHHFIQSSCKYFGGRHQLYLDRKQFVTTTTSESFQPPKPKWISSGRPGTPSPFNTCWNPFACLAKMQPRANQSLLLSFGNVKGKKS